MTAAEVLRRAAEAYRNGDIQWGREWFLNPEDGCRCALGAVAYAVDPDTEDGDPRYAGPGAEEAARVLADYLVDELGVPRCVDVFRDCSDPIETVGGWNDDPARTPDEVIAALEAASERAA